MAAEGEGRWVTGPQNLFFTDPSPILEGLTEAFFALDAEWRFVYLNSEAEHLLLSSRREDLLGKDVRETFTELADSRFHREYRRTMEERATVRFEEYHPTLATWFEVKAYPLAGSGISVHFRVIYIQTPDPAEGGDVRDVVHGAWGVENPEIHSFISGAPDATIGSDPKPSSLTTSPTGEVPRLLQDGRGRAASTILEAPRSWQPEIRW